VELLKSGAKLAKPVVNDSGMILIGEGTVLKESHIDRLQYEHKHCVCGGYSGAFKDQGGITGRT